MALSTLGLAALCIFLGGAVKGVAALGLPLVAVPLLTWVVGLKSAVALLVLPMIGSNLVQSLQGGRFIASLRRFWLLAAATFVFAILGTRVLVTLPLRSLELAIGLLLIVLPLVIHLRPGIGLRPRHRLWADPAVGAIAGILGGVAALQGPPLMIYLLAMRLSKDEFVAGISLVYWVAPVGILIGVVWSGVAHPAMLGLSALMLVPAGIGLRLGQVVQFRLSEAAYGRLLICVYLATGASFLIRAAA